MTSMVDGDGSLFSRKGKVLCDFYCSIRTLIEKAIEGRKRAAVVNIRYVGMDDSI